MEAIYIPQIQSAKDRKETLQFEEFLPDLETLTPVRGQLSVTHRKTFLEVTVEAETIVTLCCDRCLQHYNRRLALNTSELIWLEDEDGDSLPSEREIALEDLSEILPPQGYFDPNRWLYEQFCLAMPAQQLCGNNCRGIEVDRAEHEGKIDNRWAGLAALKDRFSPEQSG
ncbi:YceD family protein [Oscillatoria sp. FACHB-1406]|uniref:YceD family protein n=1 Tax=Oscillatoria sp. FACHB-1406 TaxID=2692846 RepID=UPI001688E19E|nr:YceD family protein [Oscillatoria sp. FACHB-1406]MBD2577230.1 DUF177 domain-containing protein [Oscillatoria sp. FACHB-1406]